MTMALIDIQLPIWLIVLYVAFIAFLCYRKLTSKDE